MKIAETVGTVVALVLCGALYVGLSQKIDSSANDAARSSIEQNCKKFFTAPNEVQNCIKEASAVANVSPATDTESPADRAAEAATKAEMAAPPIAQEPDQAQNTNEQECKQINPTDVSGCMQSLAQDAAKEAQEQRESAQQTNDNAATQQLIDKEQKAERWCMVNNIGHQENVPNCIAILMAAK